MMGVFNFVFLVKKRRADIITAATLQIKKKNYENCEYFL